MFFSDLHVQLLARGILQPGEQLVSQTVTSYMPWWAFGMIRRQYLVMATDQRLVMLDHRYGFFIPTLKLHQVDSLQWQNVQEVKVKGLFLKKKLRVRGTGERGQVNLTMPIPNGLFGLLAPMKNNKQGARGVAAQFQNAQQNAMALAPASQGYPQPQIAYAQPAAQLPPAQPQQQQQYTQQSPQAYSVQQPAQQQYAQAPAPAVNAPGYQSQPPPAPQYGAPTPPPGTYGGPRSWP